MTRHIPTEIASTPFDVIIIGAGINGAGIARDAAMRGLKVLLLDKSDLAAGTSSWSTRLIHGGLRYLEHGEIGLVRESLRERESLLRTAPHLVKPLPLLIPIYDRARRHSFTIRAGMLAYDLLSFDKSLDTHRMLSREEVLRRAPGLNPEGLRGAALYYDAQVEYAERLVLENVLSAREHGAVVITYARAERLILQDRAVRGVEFTDVLAGDSHLAHASLVVNASGPWVDEVLAGFGLSSARLIGGTKGSHLVVAPFDGAPPQALYAEASADGRPFFIIPWNHLYLIGTTDVRYEGELDSLSADSSEIDYLLGATNLLFPQAHLTTDYVLYTYTGVRPLAYSDDRAERSITRRHFIHDHAPQLEGFLSIVGGKLTTYRNLSEQAVNLLFKKLGRRKNRPRSLTAQTPLPGAITSGAESFTSFSERFINNAVLPRATSERLLAIYGTRAASLLEMVAADRSLARPLGAETSALAAEVLFAFREEMAQTLADCLLRRTMIGLNARVGVGADEVAAQVACMHLGWPAERAEHEVLEYRRHLRRFHPLALKADKL